MIAILILSLLTTEGPNGECTTSADCNGDRGCLVPKGQSSGLCMDALAPQNELMTDAPRKLAAAPQPATMPAAVLRPLQEATTAMPRGVQGALITAGVAAVIGAGALATTAACGAGGGACVVPQAVFVTAIPVVVIAGVVALVDYLLHK